MLESWHTGSISIQHNKQHKKQTPLTKETAQSPPLPLEWARLPALPIGAPAFHLTFHLLRERAPRSRQNSTSPRVHTPADDVSLPLYVVIDTRSGVDVEYAHPVHQGRLRQEEDEANGEVNREVPRVVIARHQRNQTPARSSPTYASAGLRQAQREEARRGFAV